MIGTFVTHDADGRIASYARIEFDTLDERPDLIESDYLNPDPDKVYVEGGRVVLRPRLPAIDRLEIAADGADEATITSLPEGTRLTLDGEDLGEITSLTLFAEEPGTFHVGLKAPFPYLDSEFTVTCV